MQAMWLLSHYSPKWWVNFCRHFHSDLSPTRYNRGGESGALWVDKVSSLCIQHLSWVDFREGKLTKTVILCKR